MRRRRSERAQFNVAEAAALTELWDGAGFARLRSTHGRAAIPGGRGDSAPGQLHGAERRLLLRHITEGTEDRRVEQCRSREESLCKRRYRRSFSFQNQDQSQGWTI